MTDMLEYPVLKTYPYTPGEPFPINIRFVADEGETEYLAGNDYSIAIEWPARDDELYDKLTADSVSVVALAAPDRGIRITLVIPQDKTSLWPNCSNSKGIIRILRDSRTIAVGEIKFSKFAKNR